MTLYRATYATEKGTRHMTFSCAFGHKYAWNYALQWSCRDKLEAVATVPARRPEFQLTFSEVAA